MALSLDTLTRGLDDDFRQVIKQLQDIFVHGAAKVQGRPTHTHGVGARGEARIIVPMDFPENDLFVPGRTYPVILRHSSPGGQKDNRARDGAAASLKFYAEKADAAASGVHDILMNTGRALFVRSARGFLSMVTTPNADRLEKLVKTGILRDEILSEGYRNGGSFTDFYYHSQICFELRDRGAGMNYLRFRLLNGDLGPERGCYPASWTPNGQTFYPPLDNDPRSDSYLKDDLLSRLQHGEIRYRLQGQLRPGNDIAAVDCSGIWDSVRHPWLDLAEIRLNEPLTMDELDALTFDANWTHPAIALPLATSGLWQGPQAENPASLGHVRALVYALSRKARAEAPQPHAN